MDGKNDWTDCIIPPKKDFRAQQLDVKFSDEYRENKILPLSKDVILTTI